MVKRKKIKFTLIEMLVVITIIAILAALLMPALKSAIDMGRQASCSNNQHQLYAAIIGYTGDNANQMVYGGTVWGGHRYWPAFITGRQSSFWSGLQDSTEYTPYGQVFGCPATFYYSRDASVFGKNEKAYGISFCGDIKWKTINDTTSDGHPVKMNLYNFTSIRKPGDYILLADSLSMWSAAKRMTASVPNNTDNLYSSRIHLLHSNEQANTLHFDGHVEPMDMLQINESPSNHRHFFDSEGNALPLLPAY